MSKRKKLQEGIGGIKIEFSFGYEKPGGFKKTHSLRSTGLEGIDAIRTLLDGIEKEIT